MEGALRDLLLGEFTNDEQRRFVEDYEKYLEHGDDSTKHIVNLDDVWKSIGYKNKSSAKQHILSNYIKGEDYVLSNKDTILLNVNAFRMMCLTAKTKEGMQTRVNYMKMKTIFQTYIKQTNAAIIDEMKNKSKIALEMQAKQLELQRHDHLIESYKNKQCMYVFRVNQNDSEDLIVKLGQTKNIAQRAKTLLKEEHKDILLLDVFPCDQAHNFEQYLFKRTDIKDNRITNTKLVRLTQDFTYNNLISTIEKNIDSFQNPTLELMYRMRLLELISETTNQDIQALFIKELKRFDNANHTEDVEEVEEPTPPHVSNNKVYKYHADDLSNPIDSYYSIADAARSLNTEKSKVDNVRDACKTNTQLDVYRFFIVKEGDELPTCIPATEHVTHLVNPLKGLVVKLNKENMVIVKVYASKVEAGADNNVKACGITSATKNSRVCAGHRWCMYEECSDDQKQSYSEPLPTHISSTNSKAIYKVDPGTNSILEKFDCVQDVRNKYKICHKKVNSLSATGDIYKGAVWVFEKDYSGRFSSSVMTL
jgi:hypothetical protein